MALVVGDIVRLKTGGPDMVVEAADQKRADVVCTWLAEKVRQHARFKSLMLRKVEALPDKTERLSRWERS